MKIFTLSFFSLLFFHTAYNAQVSDCVVDLVFDAYFEYVTVGSVDFPEGAVLNWSINGEIMNNGSDVVDLSFGLFLNGPVTVCVAFVSDACPDGVEICETVDLNDIIGGGDGTIEPCTDLEGVSFGLCDMVLGIAVVNGSCTYLSGCGWEVNGIDYSPAFYLTVEECHSACNSPIDCINPDLIDPNAACYDLWAPVCGCNNVTYGNECEAINYGGVTSWTEGECSGGGGDCPEILGAMQQPSGPCNWIFEVEGSGEGAEVNWDFGDGTGESAGHIADHHYAEDGVYIATAIYLDLLCEGVVLSTVISVEGCGEVEDDCTIEFEYEFYDGYAIFEAYNYPENVELVWTYNNEVYATGTHIIEVLEPNPFPEDGVTICVGYESENCPEGVFACEWLGMEDECELELEGWVENNTGYFEAYGYPAEVNLIWSLNGYVVAEGVNEVELMTADFPEGFHLCVWYHNDECGVVEACEWIGAAGGDCPDNINVIPPKWDFCTWAFEIDTVWMGAGNPPSWMEIGWDYGDGSVLSNEDFWSHHVYDTDGVYEVNVQYWDSNCPNGVELTVVIQVEGCGEVDCIDEDQIDLDALCTEEYAPVCGCDNVTYSNICNAIHYGGVTSWVEGECTTAVNDLEDTPVWKVFPVPTSDGLTVEGLPLGVWSMKLYDSQGREVLKKDIANGDFISMDRLNAGYYTLQIVGLEDSVKRVTIQR
jgi:hypothetical protein